MASPGGSGLALLGGQGEALLGQAGESRLGWRGYGERQEDQEMTVKNLLTMSKLGDDGRWTDAGAINAGVIRAARALGLEVTSRSEDDIGEVCRLARDGGLGAVLVLTWGGAGPLTQFLRQELVNCLGPSRVLTCNLQAMQSRAGTVRAVRFWLNWLCEGRTLLVLGFSQFKLGNAATSSDMTMNAQTFIADVLS